MTNERINVNSDSSEKSAQSAIGEDQTVGTDESNNQVQPVDRFDQENIDLEDEEEDDDYNFETDEFFATNIGDSLSIEALQERMRVLLNPQTLTEGKLTAHFECFEIIFQVLPQSIHQSTTDWMPSTST